MKFHLLIFLVLIAGISACKKDGNPNGNERGYLLSGVVLNSDTTRFEYNSKNQLVKISWGTFVTTDSFIYNSTNQLLYCRSRFRTNVDSPVAQISFVYKRDTIVRTRTSASPAYNSIRKYTLSNNRIILSEYGSVYAGVTTFYAATSISYLYNDSNLLKVFYPFAVSTYQPVDTFSYNQRFSNPYLTMGDHIWTLITDQNSHITSQGIISGESKHLPAVESYATWAASGSNLTFSGMNTYTTRVIENAQESASLPKVMKRINQNGVESTITFLYIKK